MIAIKRDGRELNRHRYNAAELAEALQRPVVGALARLIRFRNAHPAFQGEFSCPDAPPEVVRLRWRNGRERAEVTAALAAGAYTLDYTDGGTQRSLTDVADLPY